MCDYCEKAVPLVLGETNDFGIAIQKEYDTLFESGVSGGSESGTDAGNPVNGRYA